MLSILCGGIDEGRAEKVGGGLGEVSVPSERSRYSALLYTVTYRSSEDTSTIGGGSTGLLSTVCQYIHWTMQLQQIDIAHAMKIRLTSLILFLE